MNSEKKCLEQVFRSPALFGRLRAVSELWNPVTGRYEHESCSHLPDRGDSILRQTHVEVFLEWLNLGLEEEVKDIRLWLSWLGDTWDTRDELLQCVEDETATSLIPDQYRNGPDRTLFLSDLGLAVGIAVWGR